MMDLLRHTTIKIVCNKTSYEKKLSQRFSFSILEKFL